MIILADIKCIFDCRVSSFLNNSARESRSLISVPKPKEFVDNKSEKYYLESLRISEQISNALTGFELQFCRNSLRVDTEVRIRFFSKVF